MRKLILALAVAGISFAGAANAAAPHGFVAPSPNMLKNYLASAKLTRIKPSQAASSQYVKFNKAMNANPSAFRAIKLGKSGPDFGRTAYIPKVQIKGLAGNTAYIEAQSIAGPHLVGKIHLPLFSMGAKPGLN